MSDEQPKPVVGRTWADLVAESETGPKLDAALARAVDFMTNAPGRATERSKRLFRRVDESLEVSGIEPKAIPERVAIPVMNAAALEDRDEIHELWTRVLVGAAAGHDVDDYMIGLVRQLSPDAAQALRLAGMAWAQAFDGADPRGRDYHQRYQRADLVDFEPFVEAVPDDFCRSVAIARLQALGLVTSGMGMGRIPIVPTDMGLVLLDLLSELPLSEEANSNADG